jgi:putative heme iron utilization protein
MSETTNFHSVISKLLGGQRIATLATVDDDGLPHASLVPFALLREQASLLIHVSALAPHFGYLKRQLQAAVLISKPEIAGEEVHALPRVSIQADVEFIDRQSPDYAPARDAYVQRFPEAGFMTELQDFALVKIKPLSGRVVAGFGAARKLNQVSLQAAIEGS